MKAFKGIGFQLVLSFAVAVCVAIILVSLGSIRITKTSINANTEVTSEQTLDNVQEGFTTYLKTLSQPVDLLTRKNEIKHLEDQGNLDDNVKAIKDSLVASVRVTNGAQLAFFTTKTGLRVGQRLTQRQVRHLIREVLQEALTIQARAGIRQL